MVRPAEVANTTDPRAERTFDRRVIFAFIAGALLFLILFMYLGSRFFSYGETRNQETQSSRTQEDDKRAVP